MSAAGLIRVAPAAATAPAQRRSGHFRPPKGGYGRALDLPPFLAGLLAEHRSAIGEADVLFAKRRGEPIRNSDFLRRRRPACNGAVPVLIVRPSFLSADFHAVFGALIDC